MNIIQWVYEELRGYAPLIAALGNVNRLTTEYPDVVQALPVVSFSEANNQDGAFYDNQPISANEAVNIHVFTKFEVPTETIADIISTKMAALFFTRDFQADQDDPSDKVRHKVMKFSRDNIVPQDME